MTFLGYLNKISNKLLSLSSRNSRLLDKRWKYCDCALIRSGYSDVTECSQCILTQGGIQNLGILRSWVQALTKCQKILYGGTFSPYRQFWPYTMKQYIDLICFYIYLLTCLIIYIFYYLFFLIFHFKVSVP